MNIVGPDEAVEEAVDAVAKTIIIRITIPRGEVKQNQNI